MRYVIAVAVLSMGLVSLMGVIINYNAPPKYVACKIELQYTDHVATYVGIGQVYE